MYFDDMVEPNAVFDIDNDCLFQGTPEEVVKWLVENPAKQPRWVFNGKTTQDLTESEFLDLFEFDYLNPFG